jgi:hypothetical protein
MALAQTEPATCGVWGGAAQAVADRWVAHCLDRQRVTTGDDHYRRVWHVTEGLVGGDGEGRVGEL